MAALNKFVESANNIVGYKDEGSYTADNSVYTSNHKGATAFDYNWKDHPMGVALDGWHGSDIINGEEEPEIRRIMDFFTIKMPDGVDDIQLVYWGNDWNSPKDSMHFQMGYGTYENQLAVWNWINTHIQPDGTSTYRSTEQPHGGAPIPETDLSALLGNMMGNVPGVDYDKMLPYVVDALERSGCDEGNSANRIAMWGAQIGHESVGLKYMEEIASGAAYEGRIDLGNTQPGDGVRFKGRGPIQVTGRHNYTVLSQWAFDKGLVSTPSFFVDSPEALAELQYAFLGAIWYWTVARKDINSLCDTGDVVAVTQRINGGYNGLEDRTNRWNHCRTLDVTAILEEDWMAGVDPDRLNRAIDKIIGGGGTAPDIWPSRTMFGPVAEPSEGVDDTVGILLNADGNIWNVLQIIGALLGVERDAQAIRDQAAGKFPANSYASSNPWLKARAIEFATKVEPLIGLLTPEGLGFSMEDDKT